MAANRGEISVRITRAGSELGVRTVAIYSHEDRFTQHRYKADEAYMVGEGKTPVGAYLDMESIIKIAKENGVNAIHPGYGFLSERVDFAELCEKNGITFIGPTVENLKTFGDKTSAKEIAIKAKVSTVPGSQSTIPTLEEAREFIEGKNGIGYPVMVKAALGGGGRGMRVVKSKDQLEEAYTRCKSEAKTAFGCEDVFIERYIDLPRHCEVQILGDGTGNVVHLFDRDCSVQRRHQKVIETAPVIAIEDEIREKIFQDAINLMKEAKYRNAGTVEFLVDQQGRHYFMEVNPRVQVEHTVTEEITGIDIVQNQILIASGCTLDDLQLSQEKIKTHGYAIQCRVTTENPSLNLAPDAGKIEVFRSAAGMGVRIDDGPGFIGADIKPFYDSLLAKITVRAQSRPEAIRKIKRALGEFRVRGVATNKSFLFNVLNHPDFINNQVDTTFIEKYPELLNPIYEQDRANKMLRYIGEVIVNGPDPSLGASGEPPSKVNPVIPNFSEKPKKRTLYHIYKEEGPKAFAKAVRENKGLLVTDTTWRDAHQSLLATRMRTYDILQIARDTNIAMQNCFSLENWGGATFDVALRFLNECPFDRLAEMRELVPDICFQMLLRGANGVGYTNYPDNVIYKFCEVAQKTGMDVFRIFDSLNYIENMRLGIDAVGAAGGIIEAAICYTGDVADRSRGPYTLEYFLELARKLVDQGIHVLSVKDMAGLLKPESATLLISNLRKEFPDVPIHVHMHDTGMVGIASYLACAKAGADAVDCAMDSMSGATSQPSLGALISSLKGTEFDTGLNMEEIMPINDYWEECRGIYAPFESGQKSGSADVFINEIPGGQYTNMLFQSKQLGLGGQWAQIKKAYSEANQLFGDIPKVTPSSKVVGDLAQFMVQNKLKKEDIEAKADELSFPKSVIEYFQGYLGLPPFGFPEELRKKVLKGKKLPNGKECFDSRPGVEMSDYDFKAAKIKLCDKYGEKEIREFDLISYSQYPEVTEHYLKTRGLYGNLSKLDTRTFVSGLTPGQEVNIELERGKKLNVVLESVERSINPETPDIMNVVFTVNGATRRIRIRDKNAEVSTQSKIQAEPGNEDHVGAPMPGVVIEIRIKKGEQIQKGVPLVVLSAMKMETAVTSTRSGKIKKVHVQTGDNITPGDLLVEFEEED